MASIDPIIQTAVRQLLGLRGGPPVEIIPAVQPVALVRGFSAERQPQLEIGDLLVRRWRAEHVIAAGGVGTFGVISVRVTDLNTVALVERAYFSNGGANLQVQVGRTGPQNHGSFGTARYVDHRLASSSLVASPIDIGGSSTVAPVTPVGFLRLQTTTGLIEIKVQDVLCSADLSGDAQAQDFACVNVTANEEIRASFEGVVFSGTR